MRPDWDSYFLKIAYAVSERSTCDRALVGCVLVLEKRILTTGFNGSPAGQDHCDEVGHLMVDGHCVRTIHAETNAIIQAALHGVSTRGATCYVTPLPCINCTKALINAGITRIVYSNAYRTDDNALNFLKAAHIEIVHKEFQPIPPLEESCASPPPCCCWSLCPWPLPRSPPSPSFRPRSPS